LDLRPSKPKGGELMSAHHSLFEKIWDAYDAHPDAELPDLATAAIRVLVTALLKLPPSDRELLLHQIEEEGLIRERMSELQALGFRPTEDERRALN
jgi:hypothetical protein